MTKKDLVVLYEALPRNFCYSKIPRTQVFVTSPISSVVVLLANAYELQSVLFGL